MDTRSRLIVVSLCAAAAAAFLWWLARPALPEVDVAATRRAELVVEVSTNGVIEPLDDLDVRARLDGRIVDIAEPGTRLEAGAVLLRIDDGPVASAIASAESERLSALDSLRSARNRLEQIEKRAAVDAELLEKGALTPSVHDETLAELRDARARVEFLEREVPYQVAALDLEITELEAQREDATFEAPFAGTVYRRDAKKGAMVRSGEPILRFADLDRLRVRANIDQVDLGRVQGGHGVSISSNAYPGRRWSARISEVIPHVVVKDSRYVAESLAIIEPPVNGLVPGMTVDVDIRVDSDPDVLQVPAEAVILSDGEAYVLRIERGRARRVAVELGRSSVGFQEVLGGLTEADEVILGASDLLADGTRVALRDRLRGSSGGDDAH